MCMIPKKNVKVEYKKGTINKNIPSSFLCQLYTYIFISFKSFTISNTFLFLSIIESELVLHRASACENRVYNTLIREKSGLSKWIYTQN